MNIYNLFEVIHIDGQSSIHFEATRFPLQLNRFKIFTKKND